jgi:hypothetical protein
MPGGLVGRDGEGFQQPPALGQRLGLAGEGLPAIRPDTAKCQAGFGEALSGCRHRRELGARGGHPIGLGHAAGDEVVDHHTM